MKILISALAVSIALAFGPTEKSAPSTYYYFCTSRPMKASGSRQLILYTPVKKIIAGEKDIQALTKVWGDTVAGRRGDPAVGTSDVNLYDTAESADSVLQRFKVYYADTAKYDVRVVGFE